MSDLYYDRGNICTGENGSTMYIKMFGICSETLGDYEYNRAKSNLGVIENAYMIDYWHLKSLMTNCYDRGIKDYQDKMREVMGL